MILLKLWRKPLVWIALVGLLTAACSSAPQETAEEIAPPAVSEAIEIETQTEVETQTGTETDTEVVAIETTEPTVVPLQETEVVVEATESPTEPAVEPTVPLALPLPLTPTQGEGPYYPIDKPEDRDSDLVHVAGAAGEPLGETLQLSGRVLLQDGTPLEGAVVEIWQTDGGGVYLHPNDPNFAARDQNFQSYGESVTNNGGDYAFVTLYPQLYGSRPRHIHVKVKYEGRELLTTQFYFAGDERLQSDGLVAQAGEEITRLLVDMTKGSDAAGEPVLIGTLDIVLPGG